MSAGFNSALLKRFLAKRTLRENAQLVSKCATALMQAPVALKNNDRLA